MNVEEYDRLNENYIHLMKVIAIGNYKEKLHNNKMLVVYDMQNNEKVMGVFDSSKDLGDLIGKDSAFIDRAVCKGSLLYCRFLIKRVEID